MIKKIIIFTIILISVNANAQDNRWAMEANLNPFFLGALNSESDNNVKSDGLSGGYDIGISLKYNVSDPIQLEGGVQYSKQNYNGKELSFVEEGSDFSIELSYIKFPLIVNYGWDWDYKKDTRLSIGFGGQLLSLNDSFLKIEDRLQIVTIENGVRTLYIKEEDMIKSVIEDGFFSKQRLGLIGQFGLEKQISDSFSYSIKLRTEYDLSLIDNDNNYNYDLSYFRIGLQFGIQYNFQTKSSSYIEGIL
jgi:hypothetical protein